MPEAPPYKRQWRAYKTPGGACPGPRTARSHTPQEKDFLEEMIDVWTEKDPSFRATFEAAWQQRELLRALAERREELGLSQTEVAARMGTSQSTLARLEQGSANPTLATVARLAKALGKKIEWRLIDEDTPKKEPAA